LYQCWKIPNTVNILKEFCDEHLNDEYYQLTLKLITKIARKRPSPLLYGKPNTWVAAAVHAIGMVNFLFDKSQTPHMSSQKLASYFGLSQSTISAKSKYIRDILRLTQLDIKWILPSRMDDNPMIWMIMVDNFVVDIRNESYEMQVEAYNAGVIPYIPKKLPRAEESE
jgi:uncharacterized protein DUF6398